MSDSIQSNTQVPAKYTCKPGHGSPNNTDAICTPNSVKSAKSVLHNSNEVNSAGVLFDSCCNKVVNPPTVKESKNSLSAKCNN